MQSEVREIVEQSLKKAQNQITCGNVSQAYAYYTVVVELCPEKRLEIEEIFTDVLCEWGMQLELSNRTEDAIKCYKNSIRHYPNNSRMLNNLAAHYLRMEEPLKAIKYLKKAVEANEQFLPAIRNLQNSYSMIVNEWHFSMLNDKHRNHAFDCAIRKAINIGYNTVLDIGTGTGLLSLYARSAGAQKVYACEYSSVMCNIASKVFTKNEATDITLIDKISMNLSIPEDLPERVKLIVTETFDAALFGECVLPTLIHAHLNLLDEKGLIIPKSASIFAAAVECEYLRFKSFAKFDKEKCLSTLNFANVSVLSNEELYDTENLKNVKLSYVTEPEEILKVDFNNFHELQNLCEDGVKSRIASKCRFDSTVDALLIWFKLYLDEEIQIDSSRGKSCWQFALFPVASCDFCKGDVINFTSEMSRGNFKALYTANKKNETAEYKLPVEVVTFFNDFEYVSMLEKVAVSKKENNIKNILDTCPFPIYGLTLLKENRRCEKLFFQTDDIILRNFVEKIAMNNGVSKSRISFVSDFREIDCTLDEIYIQHFDTKGEPKDWGQQSCYTFFSSITEMKNSHFLCSCLLSSSGSLLPKNFQLMGQLIFSNDLPNMIHANDINVQRFSSSTSTSSSEKTSEDETTTDFQEKCKITNSLLKQSNITIAEFINVFSVNQVFDLNSSSYLYDLLSEEKVLMEMGKSEKAECTVDFGKIDVSNGKPLPNALLCWYRIDIAQDCKLDTRRKNSFINHMAIIFENEFKSIISQDKDVKMKVYKMGDFVKINAVM